MAAHQAPPSPDSPGKNTGVGCHFLLQCMKVKSQSEVAPSCPTLCDPMDSSLHQAPLSIGFSCIGEGNGNPLQGSCLENPRDGGAWWAAIYGVAQSRTRLKRLSSSSSILMNILFLVSVFLLFSLSVTRILILHDSFQRKLKWIYCIIILFIKRFRFVETVFSLFSSILYLLTHIIFPIPREY